MSQAKFWCFTLNNYSNEDITRLSNPLQDVNYIVFGKEVGQSGTPHLQGTVCFTRRLRRNQVVAIIGRAHCTVTRDLSQSIEYCKKDGDYVEIGAIPTRNRIERTRRTTTEDELEDFKKSVREGILSEKVLRERHSMICATYPKFVKEYIEDNRPPIQVGFYTFPIQPSDICFILINNLFSFFMYIYVHTHRLNFIHYDHGKAHYTINSDYLQTRERSYLSLIESEIKGKVGLHAITVT